MTVLEACGANPTHGSGAIAGREPLVAPGWEIGGLVGLICLYLLGDEAIGEEGYGFINRAGPAWLMVLLGLGALRMGRIDRNAIWTSLFWFRIATALYFGFGTLVPRYANLTTKLYMDAFFLAEPAHIFKLNLLVALSAFTVLGAASLTVRALSGTRRRGIAPRHDRLPLIIGVAFAIMGFSIRLLLLLPYALGESSGEPIPGIVQTLGMLAPVSIYLLTSYAVNRRPALIPIMALGVLADMMVGVLLYNKTEVLTPAIMFFMAYLSKGFSWWRLVVSAGSIAAILFVIVPMTDFGRVETLRRYGSVVGGDLGERWEIINLYFKELGALPVEEEVQSAMVRLSYVNAATFAIDSYDAGRPGDSLNNAWAVFIPRLIWPEKPIITDIGSEFNLMATNSASSSSAPGLFADAYWTLGWLGIPILMTSLGVIFALTSRYSLWVLEERRWLYFPLVLMAMRMGMRVDGFFVVDVLGALVIFISLHFVASIVERMLKLLAPQGAWV